MSLDSVTETIAHFVGTFNLTIEQARLRDQYEEFTALRRKAELDELENPAAIRIKADLDPDPGKYAPLPYNFPVPEDDPDLPPPAGADTEGYFPVETPYLPGIELPVEDQVATAELAVITLQPQIITEIIGSAVTYTFQALLLRDNDTVGAGDFRDIDALTAQAEAALGTALSLHAMPVPSFALSDYLSVEYVEAIATEMQEPLIAEVDGVTVHQFHGDDAIGVIVNGQHVDEAPEWSDLLPAYHQPDEPEGEEAGPEFTPVEWDQDDEGEFQDGHSVVTGGNLAVNEVAATVAWVDAPFIAVGGQAINLTLISQVAVVSDHDQGHPDGGSGTSVVQSSEITTEAKAAHWLDPNAGTSGQPSHIHIDWIHTDLIVSNFIQQTIDATDIDHIQTEITAASTLYTMGANQLVNVTDIVQLGSYYDLIMVGGDMVSVDAIHQTLVLMDDDVVNGGLPGSATGGDENLLMNQASVTTLGQDIAAAVQNDIADAMTMAASDMKALEDALLNDPMFAGMEQMRVLKIDGDLLQLNIVEQVTMLADQDDIYLSGPNAGQTEVVAGSNALLNAANITKSGVDSVVMAADGSYSDLLLHQASLIDAPQTDTGSDLANEAIAFLMDDMTSPGLPGGVNQNGPDLTPSEAMSSTDGLQSMLA